MYASVRKPLASFLKVAQKSRFSALSASQACIDVHTHMYLPKYMDILRKRIDIPKVISVGGMDRLVILPGEDDEVTTSTGRPIGREYFDVNSKLAYMDTHGISHSVVSLANPWLDFLQGEEAASVAQELNDELQGMCENSKGRLYGFATLPVRNPEAAVKEVRRLKSLSHIRGVILGTPGAGGGIDHANMRDVLGAISAEGLMIFLHPHYGVGNEHFHDTGHALFLALGFPFETTVAVSRLIVSGAMDQLPDLKLLVAHAGAALPSLIGRLDSCVEHDALLCKRLQHLPSQYFRRLYFDAISYSDVALQGLIQHVNSGTNGTSSDFSVGADRIMFGTDNPFFPPLDVPTGADISTVEWPSTTAVHANIGTLPADVAKKLRYENACRLLNIKV